MLLCCTSEAACANTALTEREESEFGTRLRDAIRVGNHLDPGHPVNVRRFECRRLAMPWSHTLGPVVLNPTYMHACMLLLDGCSPSARPSQVWGQSQDETTVRHILGQHDIMREWTRHYYFFGRGLVNSFDYMVRRGGCSQPSACWHALLCLQACSIVLAKHPLLCAPRYFIGWLTRPHPTCTRHCSMQSSANRLGRCVLACTLIPDTGVSDLAFPVCLPKRSLAHTFADGTAASGRARLPRGCSRLDSSNAIALSMPWHPHPSRHRALG